MSQQTKLDIKSLHISPHAVERAMERFKCKNKVEALNMCKTLLGRARLIGRVTGIDGDESIMYSVEGDVILLDVDLKVIKSVIDYDSHGHFTGLKDKISKLYINEFNKVNRLESRKKKKLEYEKIKTAADIANLKLRSYKTRSKNVKTECIQNERKLLNELQRAENELKSIEADKRELARAMATVVFPV